MSVMTVLEQAQGGRLMDTIAASLDIDAAQTRKAMTKLCPAIAAKLQEKARADEELFQSLLDLIADNAETSPLATADGLTSAERRRRQKAAETQGDGAGDGSAASGGSSAVDQTALTEGSTR